MGLKILVDLFDMLCTLVVYISYNMGNWDLPDIYARALRPAALGLGHIYQANPSCSCYNLYIFPTHGWCIVHMNAPIQVAYCYVHTF